MHSRWTKAKSNGSPFAVSDRVRASGAAGANNGLNMKRTIMLPTTMGQIDQQYDDLCTTSTVFQHRRVLSRVIVDTVHAQTNNRDVDQR